MEGTVLGDGGDDFSVIRVVYPRGMVSVSSLGFFLSVGSSYKPYHPSLTLFLGVKCIQEYFKKKRGRNQKHINSNKEKSRHEEKRKQIRVTVKEKLVVGYW